MRLLRSRRARGLVVGVLPLLLTTTAILAVEGDWVSPELVGGAGGVPFMASCPRYSYLVGLAGRNGDDLDAIRPVCAQLIANGSRGELVAPETFRDGQPTSGNVGGSGGSAFDATCNAANGVPFVRELEVIPTSGVQIIDTVLIGCGPMNGPMPPRGRRYPYLSVAQKELNNSYYEQRSLVCPTGTAFAGIHGRAGEAVDALGAICRRIEPVPSPATLSSDRPAVPSPATAAAARPAGADPIGSVVLQQGSNTPGNAARAGLEPNQLLCRGGQAYPTGRQGQVPGKPEQEFHVVFVRASENVARADGSGLSIGTCGFADRVAIGIGYLAVAVDVGSRTLEELKTYLESDPNHFWSFVLRTNDAAGMDEAIRHEQWVPPARAASAAEPTSSIQGTATGVTGAGQQSRAVGGRFPANLYTLNDAGVITVGERQMTVRDAKVEVEGELGRLAEPTRAFALCAIAASGCDSAAPAAPVSPTPSASPPAAARSAPKLPAFLYGLRESSPILLTSHHSGASPGDAGAWSSTQELPRQFGEYRSLIGAGREALYGVTTSDTLRFWNAAELAITSRDPSVLVAGFAPSTYRQIAASRGVIYGFRPDGIVDVFRNLQLDVGGTSWQGPQRVADDWPSFNRVISGGDNVFYTLRTDGSLVWRMHYPGGNAWSQSVVVGDGWGQVRELFTPGDGVIYAIQPSGDLVWHRFRGHYDGVAASGWDGPVKVADGWQGFKSVAATSAR